MVQSTEIQTPMSAASPHDVRRELITATAKRIGDYRARVDDLPVFPDFDRDNIIERLGRLPEDPTPAHVVVAELADAIEPALVSTVGPRYFGFVVGGSTDAAMAADLLAVGWDQCAYNAFTSPGAAIVEDIAGAWLKDLLGLPDTASFGFVTGGQGANTVGLAAGRHHVLAAAGWDVHARGLIGSPPIRVVAGAERHATIDRTLRLLGHGTACIESVDAGPQGAIDIAHLRQVLAAGAAGPTIVCLQAGNVNTGAFDDLGAGIEIARRHDAWVHIDGAFGLWAAASPQHRHLVAGLAGADSWAVDGHKWLNVPYDCGYAFCAHPATHRTALSYSAAYLTGQEANGPRGPGDFVLESSRRARGFATWAVLRELGRSGVADLVDRCCALAAQFAERLATINGVSVANDVVLNQVLVDFGGGTETERVLAAVQGSGVCWMGGTTWRGRRLMRIAVSNWRTTAEDVDRCVEVIAAACAG